MKGGDGMSERKPTGKYAPLSPWAYFGLTILFQIPVIGLIFLIIFSISGKNINRRNFARSYWCVLVLVLIIIAVYVIVAASAGATNALFSFFSGLFGKDQSQNTQSSLIIGGLLHG